MTENCYFFLENGIIEAMCVRCHEEKQNGWLWKWSYGKKDIKCCFCGKIIYKYEENQTTL